LRQGFAISKQKNTAQQKLLKKNRASEAMENKNLASVFYYPADTSFSKVPKIFRTRKAVAKSQSL